MSDKVVIIGTLGESAVQKERMLRPLHKRIVIRRNKAKEKSGDIILPGQFAEKPISGEVLAIGTDKDLVVKVGDEVLFGRNSGMEFQYKGETLLIMPEDGILAII